jgi:hypothetical protein
MDFSIYLTSLEAAYLRELEERFSDFVYRITDSFDSEEECLEIYLKGLTDVTRAYEAAKKALHTQNVQQLRRLNTK